jgi:hypothetical protein
VTVLMRGERRPTAMLIVVLVLSLAMCLSLRLRGQDHRQNLNRDLNQAKLITSDLTNFWNAYGLSAPASGVEDQE